MNIDEKCSTPATPIQIWPETTLISRKTIPKRTLRRWRAEARARWPMYLADVAYRIERLPQPKRRHGRTWAEVARDNFLASFPAGTGIPPWAGEAYRPEHRPKVIQLGVGEKQLGRHGFEERLGPSRPGHVHGALGRHDQVAGGPTRVSWSASR